MGHPAVENETPLQLMQLGLADEELRPVLVLVVKATYDIGPQGLVLAEEQVPVNAAGEAWGEPGESSYKYEPEVALFKVATDVALVGHAHAPEKNTRELLVGFQVGPVKKAVHVVGDRVWSRSMGNISATRPLPFERIPLVYERAFGGWDRTDPARPAFEPRNPVGLGFRASPRHFEENLRLPNLEDPSQPLQRFGQMVPPTGFGFISPHWQPRAALAGTYDEIWDKQRRPLLPKDFDRRFFNAASPGLVVPGYLHGGEPVILTHASPQGRLSFGLPRVKPKLTVQLAGGRDAQPEPRMDTVIVDTDVHRVFLLWRANVSLNEGPHDVRGIHLESEGLPRKSAESPVSHLKKS